MKQILFTLLLILNFIIVFSQTKYLKGVVKDSLNNELLVGAVLQYENNKGVKTNEMGDFIFSIPQGLTHIEVSYIGYETKKVVLPNFEKDTTLLEILLNSKARALQTITISGSKFAKRAAEEIVSIEVLKPAQILNMANNTMSDALQRVPGVDVIENQVNIRGGSGWSYGAGSRVLVLVDDMPMLTADAADAKWDFLPLENCEQIEIIKGASSSLYGSSALNGVVNFRTGFAKSKPRTKIMLYNGMYGNPAEKKWIWWDKQQPGFQGGYISHSQKFGNLETVIGSAWYSEDSYLQGDLNRRLRANANLRYLFPKIKRLAIGVNTNVQFNKSQTFFFWQTDSTDTKLLQPYGGLDDTSTTINKNKGQRINIDPYIIYYTDNGTKHTLRTRWFRSENFIPEKKQSSKADTYFGEYQIQKQFNGKSILTKNLNIIGGIMSSYNQINGELFGNHTTYNIAPYMQLEKKFQKLWTSFGARYELNVLDNMPSEKKPVFRAGLNYELNKATFIRASWGQGYRYPSIAERFVKTSFGASKVFPNPQLQSETGWSSEVGIKQGFKIGNWLGFVDIAAFWTEYQNMMEFNFGLHLPIDSTLAQVKDPLEYIGFRSINVGTARINGIDFSIQAQGNVGKFFNRTIFGYTYMNPIQVNPDSIIKANMSGYTNTLKYRYRHTLKFDMEWTYKKVSLGNTLLYNSFMQNIDAVFQYTKPDENVFVFLFEGGSGLPTSVDRFRKKYNKGVMIWDLRLAVQLRKELRIAFITKNVLNTVYSVRPAMIAPPRNFTLQLQADF